MIRFNCHCSHEFIVPEDQAGGLIQCPRCSRLNDVPTLSDLENLEEGGIFKIGDAPEIPLKDVIPTATRAFTRDHVDESGNEIDLRPSVDEFLNVGTDDVIELADEKPHPKYDPVTGELIETINIKPPETPIGPDAAKIPVAKRAIGYAMPDLNPRVTPWTILMHLSQPMNLFVMMFVVLAHVMLQITVPVLAAGIFFVAPIPLIILGLIISHYGIVIEEIGVGDLDELPRPLRNASLSEDLWGPFVRFCFAILLCFWPLFFQHRFSGPVGAGFFVACMVFGLFFFPAVLLSSLLGGTYLNLRPDRVIGVIRACGRGYLVSVIAFIIGGAVYLAGMGIVSNSFLKMFARVAPNVPLVGIAIGSPVLLLGIYLFHFACWHLGMLYRANHDRFPWILQRHISSRRTDTLAQLEAARKAARRLDALKRNKPDRDQRIADIRSAEAAKRAAQKPDAKPIWDRVAETHD